jgi:putative hydrolase of the HAD superfamily
VNVVWDLGAVLLRWRPAALLLRLLPQQIKTESDAARWAVEIFQHSDWHAFDRGTVSVPDLVDRIARRTGLQMAQAQAVVNAVPAELEPMQGSVAVLDALFRAGHRQHYLSNMPAPYAQHIESAHRFFGRFASGLFSSRVQLIKPEPALFALAQREFALAGEPTLFIDDLAANVNAAKAFGWTCLHFTSSAALARDVEGLGLT